MENLTSGTSPFNPVVPRGFVSLECQNRKEPSKTTQYRAVPRQWTVRYHLFNFVSFPYKISIYIVSNVKTTMSRLTILRGKWSIPLHVSGSCRFRWHRGSAPRSWVDSSDRWCSCTHMALVNFDLADSSSEAHRVLLVSQGLRQKKKGCVRFCYYTNGF